MAENVLAFISEKRNHMFCAESRHRDLVELCRDGIFLTCKGNIVHANSAGMALLGVDEMKALRGLRLKDMLSGAPTEDNRRAAEGHVLRGVQKLRRLDGSMIEVEVAWAACTPDRKSDSVTVMHMLGKEGEPDQRSLQPTTDALPVLLGYVGSDGRYLYANAACSAWYGLHCEGLAGHALSEIHGADYAGMEAHILEALAGRQACHETVHHGPRGARNMVAAYLPDMADDGSVRGFSILLIDAGVQHDGEHVPRGHKARRQLRQLRLITDAVPVFIAQCDRNYRLRFVNRSYADRLGFNPKEVIGRRIPDIVGEEAFAESRRYIDAALAGEPQEHEVKAAYPGGDHYLHTMYVPAFDEMGNVHGVITAISDITRLRRSEEKLHQREQEFQTLVENSPDAISRIDRDMRHIYVNPAIESVFGMPAANFLGKTKTELGLPQDVTRAWDEAAREAFDSGAEQRFDFELMRGGQKRFFSTRVIPEADRAGRIGSVLCIIYDVTERTKMENEHRLLLERERAARIQAETAARARDEFLSIVSHELRAPLNGIQSWAHILENYVKEATSAPLAQRAITGIKRGVEQQVRLIEELLDVTRMMSGRLRLAKQPLMLLPVVQAAVDSVREAAAAKHIAINCDYRITGEEIDGDSERIQQVICNLLSNAVKFTAQDGNIWVTATSENGNALITVRDDGVGISQDFLPHLFDRFSQKDTSSTRGHAGLGLGLFLVWHLVQLHGGSVKAESPGEGRGTTFSVRLPLRALRGRYMPVMQGELGGAAWPLPSLKGLRILLVDDQEEVRESLAILLSTAGASVFPAGSVREVFEWLSSLQPEELPHILICDIAMPVEDGYSVLRKLRAWTVKEGQAEGQAPLARMPALALTAFSQREDRIKALTAGFQMHMTKPVSPEELIVVIAMMASRV